MNNFIWDWLAKLDYDREATVDIGSDKGFIIPDKMDGIVATHAPNVPMSEFVAEILKKGFILDVTATRQCRDISRFFGENDFAHRGLIFSKGEILPVAGANAIITWASGNKPEFLALSSIFLESLNLQDLACEKFVFTHDLSLDAREKFEDVGFQIIDVNPTDVPNILLGRHINYSKFLAGPGSGLNHVLLCDCKDVLFQEDPFVWSQEEFGDTEDFVLGFSEGWNHQQSEWNTNEQKQFIRALCQAAPYPFSRWEVLNGGTTMGTPKALSNFCSMVEKLSLSAYVNGAICTDQAAVNYIFRQRCLPDDGEMIIIDPNEHALVAHGEPIRKDLFGVKQHMADATLIHSKKGVPFALFHQWERTVYRDEILKSLIHIK